MQTNENREKVFTEKGIWKEDLSGWFKRYIRRKRRGVFKRAISRDMEILINQYSQD